MNTKNKSIDDALEKILVSAGFLGASQTIHGTPECMMAAMRAALTAAVAELAPVGAVPTGWKTVPVESTPEMRAAAMSCGKTISKEEYYCAMLSAAPQPPETVSTAPAGELSDEQIDAAQEAAYRELRKAGFNGSMGGLEWDHASARAVIAADRALRQSKS